MSAARSPRLLRTLFWVAMAASLVVALLPQPPTVPGAPSDKVQHILAFAVLTLLARAAYPKAGNLLLLAGLSAFGALIELLQAIPALHRHSEFLDWVADTGAVAAMLLLSALARRLPRSAAQR